MSTTKQEQQAPCPPTLPPTPPAYQNPVSTPTPTNPLDYTKQSHIPIVTLDPSITIHHCS